MRRVQPFTIGTKLSIPSDHIPDRHLSTPSVISEPGLTPSSAPPDLPHMLHNEEEEEGELLPHCVSSRSVRKIAICRSTVEAMHGGKSPTLSAQVEMKLSEQEDEGMKSTCEHGHLSQQEVNLALEVSLFYQQADIILNDMSRNLSQSEDTRGHFDESEASSLLSEQIDDIAADITVLDRWVHHLSELHPTLRARVRLKQKEVKICWALLLQQHSIKQSVPPEALCSLFGDRQEEPKQGPEPEPESGPGPGELLQRRREGKKEETAASESNQQSERQSTEKEEQQEETSVTLPGQVSPVRCDEHPDHHADVSPLPSSISVFLTFDPQMEGTQNQDPADSQLNPPSLHLVSRHVQMSGDSRETHCCKDSSSGAEPSVSSSITTFLPRVSTVVLPPPPSDCSVSTLNLHPAGRTRHGSTHRHRASRMTGVEGEGEDEDEYREKEASTHRPNMWLENDRTSRPPVNTELLLYVQNNSVVTMETEDSAGQLEITPGGDDSCCNVALKCTPSSDLSIYTNNVSHLKSKQDTRSKVQQPPEDSRSSISPTTFLSCLQSPEEQNQQVNRSSNSIRKTSNKDSETNEAEEQVKLPGVSSESSSSLLQEKEVFEFRCDPLAGGEDASNFRSKQGSSPMSPANILSGLKKPDCQNQHVKFSSSFIRETFNENSGTKETEDLVKPPGVSSESSSALHPQEKGFVLGFDPPTDHKDISYLRSKVDSSSSTSLVTISNLHQTQDQRQLLNPPLHDTRKTSVKSEESEDQVKPPGVSSEEEANICGDLSTLQPPGSSTIGQEHQGNKNRLIIQEEGTFIQKSEAHSCGPKPVPHQHHCVSVHTKTCGLRDHIYQPITGHTPLSTERVDKHPGPGWRRCSRVVECLTEGCCICSAGLQSRQETGSNQRPDPLRPERWLFEEVEDELEDIFRQTAP